MVNSCTLPSFILTQKIVKKMDFPLKYSETSNIFSIFFYTQENKILQIILQKQCYSGK